MKKVILSAAIAFAMACVSGCSTTSALTGLIGSKPEISAQAGAENTKQTLGLNNKVDNSNETDLTVKDSKVNGLDSSNKKKVSTSSITAETIKADKIEITNNDGNSDLWFACFLFAVTVITMLGVMFYFRRKEKGA